MFDKVMLINLQRRKDRLDEFGCLPSCLPAYEVFQAVDGLECPYPAGFNGGVGGWGCLRSHISVLERCLSDWRVETALILEDDAVWKNDLEVRLKDFMKRVNADWDMLFLGGQHCSKPWQTAVGIDRVGDCIWRTHAYAITRSCMKSLLTNWYRCMDHCDKCLHGWVGGVKAFAPNPWLFGQKAGLSDIHGARLPERDWEWR